MKQYLHNAVILLCLITSPTIVITSTGLATQEDRFATDPEDGNGLNITYFGSRTLPNGGLHIEISESGMDYIAAMAEWAVPRILIGFKMPALEGAGFSVSDIHIQDMSAPNISSQFMEHTGIKADLIFPEIIMVGKFSAGYGWLFKTEGAFKGYVRNLHLQMLITLERGASNQPAILVPHCNGYTKDVQIVFGGDGSTVLNTLRPFMEKYLQSDLGHLLCSLMEATTKAVESEMTTKTSKDEKGEPKFDPALLCGLTRLKKDGSEKPTNFGGDFTLTNHPYFSDSHMVIGMRGELLYKEGRSGMRPPPIRSITYGKRMATFVAGEYLLNTFFQHVFKHKLGVIKEELSVMDFPPLMRRPFDTICPGCKIELEAGLSPKAGAPKAQFTRYGVFLQLSGEVRLKIYSPFKTFDVIRVSLALDIQARPYIRENAVYARNLKLSSYKTSVRSVGLGGMFGAPMAQVMKILVPRKVWPGIRRKLRVAMRQRGLRLPIICGVKLRRTQLVYEHDAVLIDTDFRYNLKQFVRKLKKALSGTTIESSKPTPAAA